MHFGRKSVFLRFPAGTSAVGVFLCPAVLPMVIVVFVVVFCRLVWPSYVVPLNLCPLQGLGRGMEVWRMLWKGVFPFFSSAFIWFSFFKDSRESVIESLKKCSDESSAISANLAYWAGNGVIKFLLSWLMDRFNLPARDRAFCNNVNGTLASSESVLGCLEDTNCFVSSEEACTIWEAGAASNFWTSCNLQYWLRTHSPSVTQTSVVHCFVLVNPQFAGNFPDSIFDFNLSSLNDFSLKIFVAEAIEDDISGPTSTTSSTWSSSCVLPEALEWLSSSFALCEYTTFWISVLVPWKNKFEAAKDKVSSPFPSVLVVHVGGGTLVWVVWPVTIGFWLVLGRAPNGVLSG